MKFKEIAMLEEITGHLILYLVDMKQQQRNLVSIRMQEGKKAQVVIVDEENEVPYSQAEFLINEGNKML